MKQRNQAGAHSSARTAAPAAVLLLLTGCSGSPSILTPRGPGAEQVAGLWWFLFVVSAIVVVAITALLLVAVARRRRARAPEGEPAWSLWLIAGGGVVFPVVILAVLWGLTLAQMRALSAPPSDPTTTVEVVGWRWWWEVRYPGTDAVTANEIHIPAGEPVEVILEGGDIIHSFWVPELMPKTDMIPGRTNRMWIQADEPGTYRGQCAEFCGLQHANMAFLVIAEPRADFDAWLSLQAQDAEAPTDPTAARGLELFTTQACAGCHTVRGTDADGTLGPDLTHVGSRRTLAALTIENTPEHLLAWIADAQAIKPGNLMPPIDLDPDELRALAAYMESLT